MLTLSCPSCGAAVGFRSKVSVFAVCSFCQTTLVRHDTHLESLGKMGELQDEMTPLQIGSSGVFGGKSFDVIGRLKITYSAGVWNEWYTIFPDGKTGWLAEAQGFWAMCFPVPEADAAQIPKRKELYVGAKVLLKPHGYFEVEDIHDVVCRYSEGELPMNAAQGRGSTSVDLTAPGEKMGTIEYASDCVRVFVGQYQEFDDFKFKNLRELDGW